MSHSNSMDRFDKVIERIDAINQGDPHGKELPYSEKLTNWIKRLYPDAGEALLIAARGQHIARWESPRSGYPEGRGGYLRWREDLKKFHCEKIAEIMSVAGYSEDEISPVCEIILKKNLKTNPDSQAIEDGLCLVFLETQFDELIEKTPRDKMVTILKKTWSKMSAAGQAAAKELSFSPAAKDLLRDALN